MPRNAPQPPTPEAHMLLNAAIRDWKTVKLLSQHPDAPLSSICFHAQQYVEKVMKAVLVSNEVVFHRTHDLETLADLLNQKGINLPTSIEKLSLLNPFAVTFRYEDIGQDMVQVSIDINEVLEIIEMARIWVKKYLVESKKK